jgi:5,10-methylenetetrahydromethanopterin reductase
MCFDRSFPAADVVEFAQRLEAGGADELWVIEDCFYTAGVSLAATALAVTDRISVGIGILPAVARTAAITAMEIATLCELAPGRFIPGIGHGVQDWMAQMGVRAESPVTALEEVLVAVGRLLDGDEVTSQGRYVSLDRVRLDAPPSVRPPLLAGVRGPKSVVTAGRAAGGLVLAEPGHAAYVRWAREQAGNPDGFVIAAYTPLCVEADARDAQRAMAPWLSSLLDAPSMGVRLLPFYDELVELHGRGGTDALATMPADWWRAIGAIGTLDDAAAHVAALDDAGAAHIGLFPAPEVEIARSQIADVLALCDR